MVLNAIKILYYLPITYWHKNNIKKFELERKNNECYIIGNGPSFKEEFNKFKEQFLNKDVFVVNSFVYSDYFLTLKPKFYLITDPIIWADNICKEWKRDSAILKDISEKVNWKLNIILPYVAFKKVKPIFESNKHIKLYFFNHTIFDFNQRINHFLYKKFLSTPLLQNVVGACIFNAINMGYKKIELFGVDHSWLRDICVNNKNQVCWREIHFYGKEELRPFLKSNGETYKMYEILFDFGNMFLGYQLLYNYSIYRCAKIYNNTKESFIDSFERRGL